MHVTAEEIQAALDLWKRKGGPLTARDVIALALGAPAAMGPLPLEGVQTTGWLDDLLKQLKGEAPARSSCPRPPPSRGRCGPYQGRGLSVAALPGRWGFGACLADDMGLGKTVQALALVAAPTAAGRRRPHPAGLPDLRDRELAEGGRALHARPSRARPPRRRPASGGSFAAAVRAHDLVISSYALLHRDLAHFGEIEWAGVVLDEAQNVKNSETKQAKAARALRTSWRVALTGTPVENHVGDLWSLFEFLNPGLLGGEAEFKRDFFVPIQAKRDGAAEARLKHLTGPFVLRRLKTDRDIVARPAREDGDERLLHAHARAGLALRGRGEGRDREVEAATEAIERKGRVLAALSRLKQVCNHPAQFLGDHSPLPGRSGKLARLTEMLEEVLEVEERALVFTQFAVMGGLLKRHLQETFGREVLFLHGGVPRGQRDR